MFLSTQFYQKIKFCQIFISIPESHLYRKKFCGIKKNKQKMNQFECSFKIKNVYLRYFWPKSNLCEMCHSEL